METEQELFEEFEKFMEWGKSTSKTNPGKFGYSEIFNFFYSKIRIAELEKQEANDFIKEIAKLLGEDDLGHDGKSWSIEDFSEAINIVKQEERRRLNVILNDIMWS